MPDIVARPNLTATDENIGAREEATPAVVKAAGVFADADAAGGGGLEFEKAL